jgi:hypothetical protein
MRIEELIYAIVRRSPEDPLAVLEESSDEVAGQAIRSRVMCNLFAMHTQNPFASRADPQIAIAVGAQGEN